MDDPREAKDQVVPSEEERPPFFSTWSRLYTAVLASLIIYVVLMLVFMRAFT
jgi:hypothetical protein